MVYKCNSMLLVSSFKNKGYAIKNFHTIKLSHYACHVPTSFYIVRDECAALLSYQSCINYKCYFSVRQN